LGAIVDAFDLSGGGGDDGLLPSQLGIDGTDIGEPLSLAGNGWLVGRLGSVPCARRRIRQSPPVPGFEDSITVLIALTVGSVLAARLVAPPIVVLVRPHISHLYLPSASRVILT
jgi:hypothetical protein